jgi:hypothetical protein
MMLPQMFKWNVITFGSFTAPVPFGMSYAASFVKTTPWICAM